MHSVQAHSSVSRRVSASVVSSCAGLMYMARCAARGCGGRVVRKLRTKGAAAGPGPTQRSLGLKGPAGGSGSAEATELEDEGKNTVGFDFAIVEGCVRNAECDAYRPAYGDRVLAIEYADDLLGGGASLLDLEQHGAAPRLLVAALPKGRDRLVGA